MTRKKQRNGSKPDWMTCTCDAPAAHGIFMRCPTCGFQFRDGAVRSVPRPNTLACPLKSL